MDKQLTTAERIKNNVVLILGAIGSCIIIITQALSSVDFSTLDGVHAALPVLAAALGRLQAYGPITVQKMRAKKV